MAGHGDQFRKDFNRYVSKTIHSELLVIAELTRRAHGSLACAKLHVTYHPDTRLFTVDRFATETDKDVVRPYLENTAPAFPIPEGYRSSCILLQCESITRLVPLCYRYYFTP